MPDYPHTRRTKSKPPRIGVFQRALVSELTSNGLLVFAVLLGIVVVSQLIRLLGDAVSGRIAVEGVLALLGFAAMNYLPVLLSISLFISILLTLSRAYRDSEMVVWFGCGIGLTRWIRPVMWYALPVVGLIALLSLVLSPWALQKAEDYKRKLESRDDVAAAVVIRRAGRRQGSLQATLGRPAAVRSTDRGNGSACWKSPTWRSCITTSSLCCAASPSTFQTGRSWRCWAPTGQVRQLQ